MSNFHTLQVAPVDGPESQPPRSPDLSAFPHEALKRFLHTRLVAGESRFGVQGKPIGLAKNQTAPTPKLDVLVEPIEHTGAIVFLGEPSTDAGLVDARAVLLLLPGDNDTDAQVLAEARHRKLSDGSPLFQDDVLDEAATGPRPAVVELYIGERGYTTPLVRAAAKALPDAWFDQFGLTSADADDQSTPARDDNDDRDDTDDEDGQRLAA